MGGGRETPDLRDGTDDGTPPSSSEKDPGTPDPRPLSLPLPRVGTGPLTRPFPPMSTTRERRGLLLLPVDTGRGPGVPTIYGEGRVLTEVPYDWGRPDEGPV